MKRNWILRGMKVALFVTTGTAVFGFMVMSLWNCLMPTLFGWRLISFWQALGLLLLSKILFGGFRGRPVQHLHWRRRMMERWEQMTPRNARSSGQACEVAAANLDRERRSRRPDPLSYEGQRPRLSGRWAALRFCSL